MGIYCLNTFQVMRSLGFHFGYAPIGNPQKIDLPALEHGKVRAQLMYTLAKDVSDA